ncbi:MAG: glutamate mutase L [Chloroflexi bacterium]|nr:glutamate mutase L [Chloroflexota bacterium]
MIGSLRPAPESLLGVDVGAAFTKAALFESVEGQYRLIAAGQAPTTAEAHVFHGLARACEPITQLTGRELFREGELLAGDVAGARGVEIVAASVSCQRPLRVLATNAGAALAAQGERCQVSVLPAGTVTQQAGFILNQPWDALVGDEQDLGLSRSVLGDEAGPPFVSGDARAIRGKLSELAIELARQTVAGLSELEAASTEPIATGPGALLSLTMLIATRFGLRLAIADCGASQTMLAYASPDQEWLRLAPRAELRRGLPSTDEELAALHSELEQALHGVVDADFAADLLLGAGALARFSRWAQPAVTLLDGIQPAGVIQFALDTAGVVSQIAPFAATLPDVASRIFEQDGLTGLGAAICPRGSTKPGAKAIEVRWKVEDQEDQSRNVNAGDLVRIPLASGTKASLSLFPAKPVDVGLNRPGVAATAQVDGGRVGLIVDARFEVDGANARERWEAQLS